MTNLLILADSRNATAVNRGITTIKILRRTFADLFIYPVEWLDDPNNVISIWSNLLTSDIVLAFLSDELLESLDDSTMSTNIEEELRNPSKRVMPVILTPCSWDVPGGIFKGKVSLPRRGPISSFSDKDAAWSEISQKIRKILSEMAQQAPSVAPKPAPPTVKIDACPRCDAPLPAGSGYCRSCGQGLGGTSKTAQPAPFRSAPPVSLVAPMSALKFVPSPVVSPKPVGKRGVLLCFSRKDEQLVESFRAHLPTSVHVVESEAIGGQDIEETFIAKCSQVECVVIFQSSDFMSEMDKKHLSIPWLVGKHLPQTIPGFVVELRPGLYDDEEFPHLTRLLSVDGKAITSSKLKEESWVEIARQVRAVCRS